MDHIENIVEVLGPENVVFALNAEYGEGNYRLVTVSPFGEEIAELWVIDGKSSRKTRDDRIGWYRDERHDEKVWLCEYFLDSAHGEFTLTALVNKHCN